MSGRLIAVGAVGMLVAVACSKSASEDHTSKPPTPTPTPVASDAAKAHVGSPPHAAERHRAAASACYPGSKGAPAPDVSGCKSDAECKEGKNGRCNRRGGGHDPYYNACEYDGCLADADCGKSGVCECSGQGNHCVQANCRADADCGTGGACSDDQGCRGSERGYFCHTAEDTCVNDSDCKPNYEMGCHFSEQVGHWACSNLMCPVG